MSVNILIKRSDVASKRPDPNALYDGELALNYDAATGGLYYKDTNDNIVKVGPCQVSATAPNSTPGTGGSTGNSLGEFWFNSTSNGLFIWNGTVWVDTTLGVAVQSVSGTSPIAIDNTDPLNPIVEIDAASTTQSGAVQLNDTVTSTSTTEAATANAVKTAYDKADDAIPNSTFTAAGELIVGTGAGTYTVLAPGTAEYILQSNGDGTLSWIVNSAGDVTSVSGTAPIQVDNTDPQTPVVSVDAATTSSLGVVQVGTNINVYYGTISVPAATTAAQGAVQVGTNIDVTDGTISVPAATTSAQGAVQVGTNIDVTAGTISVPAATTAAQGAVQVGTNIDVTTGTISVANSSTTAKGVVQLNDTTNNSSTDLALTAAQGKNLQDQIDALVITSNLTFAGTFDTSVGPNGEMVTVSAAAAALTVPFVVGDALPTPAAENAEFFVIIVTGGDYGPTTTPVSTPPFTVGDWFLSSGTAWEYLNLGFQSPAATTAVEGVVYLATDLEVQTGTDTSNKAVNPASLQAKVSDSTSTTDSFAIASSTAVKSAYDLANDALPKTGGTVTGDITLSGAGIGVVFDDASTVEAISDSTSTTSSVTAASSTAVKSAYDLANAAIPNSVFNAKGDIIVGTGNDTYGNFPTGTNGQILVVDNGETFGVKWSNAAAAGVLSVTGTAPITVDNTDFQNPIIGVSAASTSAAGVVQLDDTVTSTSTTEAATANAVSFVYGIVTGALPKTGGTMTGNIIFSTGTTVNFADTASTSVAAANQLATVVDNSNGNLTIVSAFDAGEF